MPSSSFFDCLLELFLLLQGDTEGHVLEIAEPPIPWSPEGLHGAETLPSNDRNTHI
jgi:hypothetical protein